MTFHDKSRATADVLHHIHESGSVMLIPLCILAIGALLAGFIFYPYFIGEQYEHFWKGALFIGEHNRILEDMHHVPLWVKWLPFAAMVLGFILAFIFYIIAPNLPKKLSASLPRLYKFLLNKWYIDELYDYIFVRGAFHFGKLLWRVGDIKIIDDLGPHGVASRVLDITNKVVKMQTGYVYHYAFAMLIGIVALITWMMIRSTI